MPATTHCCGLLSCRLCTSGANIYNAVDFTVQDVAEGIAAQLPQDVADSLGDGDESLPEWMVRHMEAKQSIKDQWQPGKDGKPLIKQVAAVVDVMVEHDVHDVGFTVEYLLPIMGPVADHAVAHEETLPPAVMGFIKRISQGLLTIVSRRREQYISGDTESDDRFLQYLSQMEALKSGENQPQVAATSESVRQVQRRESYLQLLGEHSGSHLQPGQAVDIWSHCSEDVLEDVKTPTESPEGQSVMKDISQALIPFMLATLGGLKRLQKKAVEMALPDATEFALMLEHMGPLLESLCDRPTDEASVDVDTRSEMVRCSLLSAWRELRSMGWSMLKLDEPANTTEDTLKQRLEKILERAVPAVVEDSACIGEALLLCETLLESRFLDDHRERIGAVVEAVLGDGDKVSGAQLAKAIAVLARSIPLQHTGDGLVARGSYTTHLLGVASFVVHHRARVVLGDPAVVNPLAQASTSSATIDSFGTDSRAVISSLASFNIQSASTGRKSNVAGSRSASAEQEEEMMRPSVQELELLSQLSAQFDATSLTGDRLGRPRSKARSKLTSGLDAPKTRTEDNSRFATGGFSLKDLGAIATGFGVQQWRDDAMWTSISALIVQLLRERHQSHRGPVSDRFSLADRRAVRDVAFALHQLSSHGSDGAALVKWLRRIETVAEEVGMFS